MGQRNTVLGKSKTFPVPRYIQMINYARKGFEVNDKNVRGQRITLVQTPSREKSFKRRTLNKQRKRDCGVALFEQVDPFVRETQGQKLYSYLASELP